MYYEDHDFADPWREHETVVLHAGNLKDHRLWYAWIPLLARYYRVITLDARGHDLSTVPAPGYSWSMSGFARDLKGLLDSLRIDRAHLIGESVCLSRSSSLRRHESILISFCSSKKYVLQIGEAGDK